MISLTKYRLPRNINPSNFQPLFFKYNEKSDGQNYA